MTIGRANGLAALLLLLFLADAVLVMTGATIGLDQAMRQIGRQAAPPYAFTGGAHLLALIRALTFLGDGRVRTPLTIAATVVLLIARRRREGLALALAVAIGAIVETALKEAIGRARPDPAWRLIEVFHPSFPSGHAMGAMILYPLLGLAIGRAAGGTRWWVASGIAIALAIGATRVLLGVHWASDVAGGWLLGAAFAAVAAGFTAGGRRGA